MINFSKVGTIDELIAAVKELPETTSSTDAALVARAKAGAIAELEAVLSEKVNGASLNLRANIINNFRQMEIQVVGRWIEPKKTAETPAPETKST